MKDYGIMQTMWNPIWFVFQCYNTLRRNWSGACRGALNHRLTESVRCHRKATNRISLVINPTSPLQRQLRKPTIIWEKDLFG